MSTDDEDDTQRRHGRARSHWDGDQRALVSRRARTPVHGVVHPKDDPEDTSPIETILGEPDTEDIEALRRARRDSDAHVNQLELVKTIRYFKRKLTELSEREKSNNEQRADQLLEMLNRPPHEDVRQLQRDVGDLKSGASTVRKAMLWVAVAALGALATVGGMLYTRGGDDRETRLRIDNLERGLQELRSDVRESNRSTNRWPLPATKAPQ